MKIRWIILSLIVITQLALLLVVVIRLTAPKLRSDADLVAPTLSQTPQDLVSTQAEPVSVLPETDDPEPIGASRQRFRRASVKPDQPDRDLDGAVRRLRGAGDPSEEASKPAAADFHHGLPGAHPGPLATPFDESANQAIDELRFVDTPALTGHVQLDASRLDQSRRTTRLRSHPLDSRQDSETLKRNWWVEGIRTESVEGQLESIEPQPLRPLDAAPPLGDQPRQQGQGQLEPTRIDEN